MKIYSISGSVGDSMGIKQHWHYEPTKSKAEAYRRDYHRDDPNASLEISAEDVDATRAGIADALNALIEWTCLNE